MDVLTGTEGEHHAGGDGCRIIQILQSGSGNIDSIIELCNLCENREIKTRQGKVVP